MNPLVHKSILMAASGISWLGLVYSASSQSGLGQTRSAHDAAGETNAMLPPLVDLGPGQTYHGQEGGLYPGGSNLRPVAHDAAGRKIAQGIVPLDSDGNPDPVNGKIVFMPLYVPGDDCRRWRTQSNQQHRGHGDAALMHCVKPKDSGLPGTRTYGALDKKQTRTTLTL